MRQHLTSAEQFSEHTVRGGDGKGRQYILRATVIAIALAVFLSAGVAIASAEAGPDSILYPVKRTLEDLKTSLASEPSREAELETSHAAARLDEVEAMIIAGKTEFVPSLLASYDKHVENAQRCIKEAAALDVNTSDLEARLDAIGNQLDIILIRNAERIREEAPEALELALERSRYRELGENEYESAADIATESTEPGQYMDANFEEVTGIMNDDGGGEPGDQLENTQLGIGQSTTGQTNASPSDENHGRAYGNQERSDVDHGNGGEHAGPSSLSAISIPQYAS